MDNNELFNNKTQAFVYGYQQNAIQRMLDFDYACQRETPSVAAIINPTRAGLHKCFWGSKEILIPMYRKTEDAVRQHPQADVMVNFASFRSSFETSMEALETKSIRTVAIIAEGIPERQARILAAEAKKRNKCIIGPATVGGIKAGCFKIGNTAGTLENIIASKLHRPGCVGFVSKSGGLSNECYNIIARNTNGLYEGIAIGGDRYPGSTLIDHCLRYEGIPEVAMIVMLGEVGGEDEYEIVEALKSGKIKKPLVAWVSGTCAKVFPTDVQFGHAGAKADNTRTTADAKNAALREAGAKIPNSFDDYDAVIRETYEELKKAGKVKDVEEKPIPVIPEDFTALKKAGRVRKATQYICNISNDSGEELTYNGIQISKIIKENWGLGRVIGHLWFKKDLPKWAADFVELALKITADHGPCVSGAHNAIVAARAGKDLMSSVASGILTIGPRFGGAIDDAARFFSSALERDLSPVAFIKEMKNSGKNIPGIGHKVKSKTNPDMRVELLIKYARENFPKTSVLDYAMTVEAETLKKKNNLILNVDGCIGILFVDLMNSCDSFTKEEAKEMIELGCLNAFFMIGRAIGMVGHYFDQKRQKAGLYRVPYDDVLFTT